MKRPATPRESPLERLLAWHIAAYRLPKPEREYKAIADRNFRWDFAWPEKRLLVEVQGGIWIKGAHATGKGITRDAVKLNLATNSGWKCLAVTGDQVRSGQAIAWIKEALYKDLYKEVR